MNLERECRYETDGANALKSEVHPLKPQLHLLSDSSDGKKPPISAAVISFTEFKARKTQEFIFQKKIQLMPSISTLKNLKVEIARVLYDQKPKDETNLKPIAQLPDSSKKEQEYTNGPISAFGIGAYKKLYNRYLEVSNGDKDFAKKYTRMAIIKDGTPFIQEYFADAKDKKGQYIISDHVMRAQLTHTPTKNEYMITTDPESGKKIITSPEYAPLGVSITKFVSGFRRGADAAMIELVQEKGTSLATGKEGQVAKEFLWGSSRSQDWEGYWINKYCSKYGYIYKGSLLKTADAEKLVVFSYKVDSNSSTQMSFMQELGGDSYQASFEGLKSEDRDEKGAPRELDVALRTLTILDRPMQDREVISRVYAAKGKQERSNLMFNLDEKAMQYANNPFLRDKVEAEVSTPVADWLIEEIAGNVPEDSIQKLIINRFVAALKIFVRKTEKAKEKTVEQVSRGSLTFVTPAYTPSEVIPQQEMRIRESLRKRTEVGGGFCGDLEETASSIFDSAPLAGGSNLTYFTSRSRGFAMTSEASGFAPRCIKCKLELCEGACPNCERNARAA